ncbi:MAG: HAD family hydrolase [Desulfotomaculales bacterium]
MIGGQRPALVILDVDGVLAPPGLPVPGDVAGLVREVAARCRVAFASGKPAPYLEGLARGMGLPDVPVIAENGGVVYLPDKKEEVVYTDLYPEAGEETALLRARLAGRLAGRCWFQPNKVAVTGFPRGGFGVADLHREFEAAVAELGLRSLVIYVHPDAVDAVPAGLDKGWGADVLADLLGLPKGDFAAVGDGPNDLPLLRKASLAVGVGDHPQVGREAAFSFPTGKDALAFLLSRLD